MIPPKIHQIVLGNARAPQIDQFMSGWRQFSTCSYHRWDDAAAALIFLESFPEYLDLYRQARNPAEASDIARLAILCLHGGYYIDWDIELLDPTAMAGFMESHRNEHGWAVVDSSNESIANELLAFAPRSELLLSFLRHLSGVPVSQRPPTPQFSGPWGFTEWYRRSGYSLRLFETCELFQFRYRYDLCPTKGQPMVHHWMHTWLEGSPFYIS